MRKKMYYFLVSLLLTTASFAQQWAGSATTAGDINRDGNVGIGTTSSGSKIHTLGANLGLTTGDRVKHLTLQNLCGAGNYSFIDVFAYRNAPGDNWYTASSRIQQTIDVTPMAFVEFNPPGLLFGMALGTANQSRFYINSAGQVGIGTTDFGSFKLTVEGKIGAREVRVTSASPWPDYVFNKKYELKNLYSLESYIRQNNHLPNIPSAQEVNDNGIELGKMNAKLLEKIEELTLYIIDLNKKIDNLEKQVQSSSTH